MLIQIFIHAIEIGVSMHPLERNYSQMEDFDPEGRAVYRHHTNALNRAMRDTRAAISEVGRLARATLDTSRAVISVLVDIGRAIDAGMRAWTALTGGIA